MCKIIQHFSFFIEKFDLRVFDIMLIDLQVFNLHKFNLRVFGDILNYNKFIFKGI